MKRGEFDEKTRLQTVEEAIDIESVVRGLLANTDTLLKQTLASPQSLRIRFLLLQHLSALLTALENQVIPPSYVRDLIHQVMPVTQYLTTQHSGNMAKRYHDRLIRWMKALPSPDDYHHLLAQHCQASGLLEQRVFEDKPDESQCKECEFSEPGQQMLGLRKCLEGWCSSGEEHPILTAEMVFLYQITRDVLTGLQAAYTPPIHPSINAAWESLQETIVQVARRLSQSSHTSLAWHWVYTLQQKASHCEFTWQQRLLSLLWMASQHLDVLQNRFPLVSLLSDWQRYRGMLVSPRAELASALSDLQSFGGEPHFRLKAAQ